MALVPPQHAIYPKKHFKSVKVIHDGTKSPHNEFSIAELELYSGEKVIGIRHDRNVWNDHNEEKGYPVVRGGRPSWFVMPDMNAALPILNALFSKDNDSNFLSEFWIGQNSNLSNYWTAYNQGEGYKQKFKTMSCHVIEMTFEKTSKNLPLFNLEPIYKTLKAYYHDLKRDILPENEYNAGGPLFIYEINRGSGIWTFLGELWYLLVLGTTLNEEKIKGQRIDNIEKKLRILKEYFGENNVRPELFQRFMQADTPDEMEQAMQNLFEERIKAIRISKSPIITNIEDAKKEMIDLKQVFKQLGP